MLDTLHNHMCRMKNLINPEGYVEHSNIKTESHSTQNSLANIKHHELRNSNQRSSETMESYRRHGTYLTRLKIQFSETLHKTIEISIARFFAGLSDDRLSE